MPLTDPTQDLSLLTGMRNGDAAAFEQLYRRHQGPLYRFALLRCGSAAAAADIVQEIFLALLNDTLKFDPTRGVLQSFLFGVARNLLLKQHDTQRRYVSNSNVTDGDEDEDVADHAAGPLERLMLSETAENVRGALRRISPHYRDVLILYEMHDLSYVEIAQICDIDLGTVRSRLSRARAKLLQLLEGDGEAPRIPAAAANQLRALP
ncbi:MAG: RNA polymerase sigma factor [Usitatibacteraceae bacterium]